jgi:DNA (cytosine-5)-methyltransferase 1
MSAYYNEIDAYAAQWLRNLINKDLIAQGDVDERSICDVASTDLKAYRQCHFFAGIGGWSYALRLAGWADDRPIWTGSCPCQPFSVAGKGAGTADPRHLWPHFHRLIAAVRPPVVMGEQVAGQAGYGWLDGVCADLARESYASRGVDIPACSVDAPHIRQRLYWVALDELAHANDPRLEGGERRRSAGAQGEPAGYAAECGGGDVAHAPVIGREERERQDGQQDAGGGSQGGVDPAGAGSFWDDHVWLTGADGKSRRSKPGLSLLAHGIPNRVGRLRAYGNAIVPQVAAEVIRAFMECEP